MSISQKAVFFASIAMLLILRAVRSPHLTATQSGNRFVETAGVSTYSFPAFPAPSGIPSRRIFLLSGKVMRPVWDS